MTKEEVINKLKKKHEELYYGVHGEDRLEFIDWLDEMIGKEFYGFKVLRADSGFLKIEKIKK